MAKKETVNETPYPKVLPNGKIEFIEYEVDKFDLSGFEIVSGEMFGKRRQKKMQNTNHQHKGIYAIKKAKKNIQNMIYKLLLDKGLTEFEPKAILRELPIIFAVKNSDKDIPDWCFLIEEKIRNFNKVLAVSVDADKANVIDGYFLFSVQNFSRFNSLILHKNDSLYNASKIEINNAEDIITSVGASLKIV